MRGHIRGVLMLLIVVVILRAAWDLLILRDKCIGGRQRERCDFLSIFLHLETDRPEILRGIPSRCLKKDDG